MNTNEDEDEASHDFEGVGLKNGNQDEDEASHDSEGVGSRNGRNRSCRCTPTEAGTCHGSGDPYMGAWCHPHSMNHHTQVEESLWVVLDQGHEASSYEFPVVEGIAECIVDAQLMGVVQDLVIQQLLCVAFQHSSESNLWRGSAGEVLPH